MKCKDYYHLFQEKSEVTPTAIQLLNKKNYSKYTSPLGWQQIETIFLYIITSHFNDQKRG